jgi:hypothetical protein
MPDNFGISADPQDEAANSYCNSMPAGCSMRRSGAEGMLAKESTMTTPEDLGPGDRSSDSDDRIREFLERHGGPGARKANVVVDVGGLSGWSEVYAADGYTLRCDWSRMGEHQEMKFSENPPAHSR